MILREALSLVAGGILIGALTARAATQWIGSLLFGLEPGDLTTIALSAAAMLTVAVLAGYLPARRAASLDPMRALRLRMITTISSSTQARPCRRASESTAPWPAA